MRRENGPKTWKERGYKRAAQGRVVSRSSPETRLDVDSQRAGGGGKHELRIEDLLAPNGG